MWIMSTLGFFSVVCARKGKGRKRDPIDPDRLMVRARRREHLDALQARFPELREYDVHESTRSDYRFRIFVPKSLWAGVMSKMVEETAYDNFKGKVSSGEPRDEAYERALHRVWSVMYRLQSSDHDDAGSFWRDR